MYKQFFTVILLFLLTVISGCSDSNECNQGYGFAPTPVAPTVKANITGFITEPLLAGKPVGEVRVFFTNDQGRVTEVFTDVDGSFTIGIEALKGSEITLSFVKDGYYISQMTVSISQDGNISYDPSVLAYLMLRSDNVNYLIDILANGITPIFSALTADGKYLYLTLLNSNIVRMDTETNEIVSIAGIAGSAGYNDGPGAAALFGSSPMGIALSPDEDALFVCDATRIRKITGLKNISSTDVMVYTIAGTGDPDYVDGRGDDARFEAGGSGLAISPDGNTLYKAESYPAIYRGIRAITGVKEATSTTETDVWTLAGKTSAGYNNGPGNLAQFWAPVDVKLSSDGDTLYVADSAYLTPPFSGNNNIRKIVNVKQAESSEDVTVFTIAGSLTGETANVPSGSGSVPGSDARFSTNFGIAISDDDDTLFVSDYGNKAIKVITGVKGAMSGDATEVKNMTYSNGDIYPWGLSPFKYGSILYVCEFNFMDSAYHRVLRIIAEEN